MFATIYLPNFYLQAATRHQPELRAKPVALIDEKEAKAAIMQLNEAAEEAGVRKGMTPSQGLARCLSLLVKTRKHSQEKLIDKILLQYAFTLAPYVEASAPGVCTIQFNVGRQPSWLPGQTGCQALDLNGEDARLPRQTRCLSAKLARLIEQLADCDITAQAGIAHLPDTSFLAAHLAHPVLQIDDAKEFLAPLPIETLAITFS